MGKAVVCLFFFAVFKSVVAPPVVAREFTFEERVQA